MTSEIQIQVNFLQYTFKNGLKLFSYLLENNKLRQLNSHYLYILIKININ